MISDELYEKLRIRGIFSSEFDSWISEAIIDKLEREGKA